MPEFQQKVRHCCCPMTQHRATSSKKNCWQHHGGAQTMKGFIAAFVFFLAEGAATSTASNDRQSRLPAIGLTWNAKPSPVVLRVGTLPNSEAARFVCKQGGCRKKQNASCSQALQLFRATQGYLFRDEAIVDGGNEMEAAGALSTTDNDNWALRESVPPQEAVVGAGVCIGMPANLPAMCVTQHNCLLLSLRKWKPQQTFHQIAQTPRGKLPT